MLERAQRLPTSTVSSPSDHREPESPSSVFNTLNHIPYRKRLSDEAHKYCNLSQTSERRAGYRGVLRTRALANDAPQIHANRRDDKKHRAATVLCAVARGRAMRRKLEFLHATAAYLQSRVLLHLQECRRKRSATFLKHGVALRAPFSLLQYRPNDQIIHLCQMGAFTDSLPPRRRTLLESIVEPIVLAFTRCTGEGIGDGAPRWSTLSNYTSSESDDSDVSGKVPSFQDTFSYYKGKPGYRGTVAQ